MYQTALFVGLHNGNNYTSHSCFNFIADYKESFLLFDSNGDGQLSGAEIEKMFQAAGQNPTKKELDEIMKTGDKDGNRIAFKML